MLKYLFILVTIVVEKIINNEVVTAQQEGEKVQSWSIKNSIQVVCRHPAKCSEEWRMLLKGSKKKCWSSDATVDAVGMYQSIRQALKGKRL